MKKFMSNLRANELVLPHENSLKAILYDLLVDGGVGDGDDGGFKSSYLFRFCHHHQLKKSIEAVKNKYGIKAKYSRRVR